MPLSRTRAQQGDPGRDPDLTAEAAEAGAELLADLGSDQVTQGLLRLHASRMTAPAASSTWARASWPRTRE